MKKSYLLLFILLVLPFISSIDINMKDSFNQRETITATFSGSFLDAVTKENIAFYRGHVKVPFDFELMKAEDNYYIYALNEKSSENYSIALENLRYYKQGEIVDEPVYKNFTINQEFADFTINPGFIRTTKDFEIELQNLKDTKITININNLLPKKSNDTDTGFFSGLFGNLFLTLTGKVTYELEEQTSITLTPNEIKKIEFNVEDIPNATTKTITLSSENTDYEFLLYISSPVKPEYKATLNFNPSELKVSLEKDLTTEETVTLKNIGDKVLENITIKLSNDLKDYIIPEISEIYDLEPNKSVDITLFFDSTNLSQTLQGELTAKIPEETEDISITLELIGENNTDISAVSSNCKDLNGTLFESPQECLGEIRFANDGNCCIGEIKESEETNTAFIVGWLIIMIIVLALVWFFKFKYKKGKEEINLFEVAKGKD